MNNYDLSVLFNSSDGEEKAKECQTKLEKIITSTGGGVYESQFNGRIDLVNTFRKHTQAYSARIQYKGSNKTLEALHKEFKINETIIRQLNARLESVYNEKQLAELVN